MQDVVLKAARAGERAAQHIIDGAYSANDWPRPEDRASELAATRACLVWMTGAHNEFAHSVTLGQLAELVRVWRESYFAAFVRAMPDRRLLPLATIGAVPVPGGGGGGTFKVWSCRECGQTIPLDYLDHDPVNCPVCRSPHSIVYDTEAPDPAAVVAAFDALIAGKLPSSTATLAGCWGLNHDRVAGALLRLQQAGRVELRPDGFWRLRTAADATDGAADSGADSDELVNPLRAPA